MAKWKMAGHMAVAMREAEKQAEQKRILEEQQQESIKNVKLLRKLQRQRANVGRQVAANFPGYDRACCALTHETAELKKDALVVKSDYFQRQDYLDHRQVMDSIAFSDTCQEEAKRIRAEIDMINRKEKEVDAEMAEARHKLKALNRLLSNVHVVGTDKMERRKERAHVAYGKQLEENRKLLAKVQHLRYEKDELQAMLDQLQYHSDVLSKNLHEQTEEARTTYEQRDQNRHNMVKLADHLDKSTTAYESDMQLLQFQIDVLKRMERFMTSKNKFRSDDGRERRREQRSQLSTTEKDSIMFNATIHKIRKDFKEHDLHVIVKTFQELEGENYMLFKNISETRDACHNMQVEIDDCQTKIESYRKSTQQSEQCAFTHKLDLMEKVDMCKEELVEKEEHIQRADQVIKTYIRGILAILDKLGYNKDDLTRLAGVYKCVEERNIRVFLAEIEHCVNKVYDLKTLADYIVYDGIRKQFNTTVPPEPAPPRLEILQRGLVVPPPFEEVEEDEAVLPPEASFRPLTWDEMSGHVYKELEVKAKAEEQQQAFAIPSPTMADATSEAIGDSPQSPPPARTSVDIF